MYRRGKLVINFFYRHVNPLSYVNCNVKPNFNNVQNMWALKKFTSLLSLNSVSIVGHYTNSRSFRSCTPLFLMRDKEIRKRLNEISDKFGEAMELLSDARSSMGTVYFSDDMTDAEAMIDEVLKDYENFLGNLTDSQSKDVTRAIGLKMEELNAQLQLLKESIKD